ncbi:MULTISPECIES: hypothetical protein [unclassified Clostridium]|uniref:hypothetical protein n=1 Tax=unclassified Clostridium TaxID=2614128 RepID=UPI0002980E56|nr:MULTISPECIES: hypothetical protein [unclassified Clostridium]EKQ57756.1 MAG: hypothetical protein A370_00557 [Clostridium sp. Maddingley MBC34-26]
MSKLLIPIDDDTFKTEVTIRFNNILEGFDSFKNFTLTASNIENGESKIIKFIEYIFKINNYNAYVDFYINKISDEDKKKLFDLVPDEDTDILKSHLNFDTQTSVFFKLVHKELIPFLVRLNTREIFFVTFYFTYKPITVWGNYDLKFPCFFNTQEDLEFYYNISKSFDLSN